MTEAIRNDGDLSSLGVALRADVLDRVEVTLPHDLRRVELQAYVRHEKLWTGELPAQFGAIPNKTPYELDGRPFYPELLIVRLLESAGWSAAWRKAWNGEAFWGALRVPVEPPAEVLSVLDQVSTHAGHAGQWDIVAWRDRRLRLLTSRSQGGQLVSAYQAAWLSVALRMGLSSRSFAAVEHRVALAPRRRRLEHIKPTEQLVR